MNVHRIITVGINHAVRIVNNDTAVGIHCFRGSIVHQDNSLISRGSVGCFLSERHPQRHHTFGVRPVNRNHAVTGIGNRRASAGFHTDGIIAADDNAACGRKFGQIVISHFIGPSGIIGQLGIAAPAHGHGIIPAQVNRAVIFRRSRFRKYTDHIRLAQVDFALVVGCSAFDIHGISAVVAFRQVNRSVCAVDDVAPVRKHTDSAVGADSNVLIVGCGSLRGLHTIRIFARNGNIAAVINRSAVAVCQHTG